jgi:redox-sensitive bicupin YhaK (pirin superfamily)
MVTLRPSLERGIVDRGWLKAHHSFSFANYQDPKHVHFGPLLVINEDHFAPTRGFGMHPHEDMEIVTYVVAGGLKHEDSTGGGGTLYPGDVQRMSAGTGVHHSEFNGSDTQWLHLLQLWILPKSKGIAPRYGEAHFTDAQKHNRLQAIASRDGRDNSLEIHQDAEIYASMLDNATISHPLEAGRIAYFQLISGSLTVNGETLTNGDAAKLRDETSVEISGTGHFLLFDLPAQA